jgi:hypothetical protein
MLWFKKNLTNFRPFIFFLAVVEERHSFFGVPTTTEASDKGGGG